MTIAGVDYTLPVVALASFLILFTAQLLLCRFTRSSFLRSLPWVWVIALLGLAVACLFGDTGGWIDLRGFFALVITGYAAICAAGIGLAHFVNHLLKR